MISIHSQIAAKRLAALADEHRDTGKALCDAVAEEYPIGSVVEATIHRSRIRGVVEEHNEWTLHLPGTFFIRSLKTQKVSTVNPLAKGQDVTLISLPSHHLQPA